MLWWRPPARPLVTDLVNGDHSIGGSSNFAAVAGYPISMCPLECFSDFPLGSRFLDEPGASQHSSRSHTDLRADDQSTHASALSANPRFEGLRSRRRTIFIAGFFVERETTVLRLCFENVCMPHSSFAPPQRPERGSAPASGIFVQGSHPILKYPRS